MGKNNIKIVAAVDVGTTKIAVVAGSKTEDGRIQILGIGRSRSLGIKRGVVFNVEEAGRAVRSAINQVEQQIERRIDEIYINIVGQQLKTVTVTAKEKIGETGIISEADVNRLFEHIRKVNLPEGEKVYHIVPQMFKVDDEEGIPNPIGSTGSRLEVDFKLLVAPANYEKNLELCAERADLSICKSVIDQLASSEILLSDEEKEAGVVLLDIGGGTTKMAVYSEGVLCYSSLIPFGGNVITHDIKEGCSIIARQAEALKVQFGQAMGEFAPEDKVVTIPGISGWEPKEISFRSLAYIIQARMEEIIEAVYFQLEKSGCLDRIGAGIVLTGGSARMTNIGQLIKYRTGMDVRNGFPRMKLANSVKEFKDPRYSTVFGLLKLGMEYDKISEEAEPVHTRKKRNRSIQPGFFSQMKKHVAEQIAIFFDEDQGVKMS